ncbi:hypothetical protein APHWI1_0261 [Anaplasma phagocytophilum str. ApWI1]|nr:hypothetical protein APHWEB_1255 [Anaplasma phagocytophilum str. Webster]KJV63152.1 hypothetical protein EPHNCH_1081 [Anaplasma phagocytophilum str. NCH-1]KJV82528.1 hypothetical protein APHHGE2_1060 [Anaplasma phagocytophilum str. HGE2]KJV84289.1 hypothetical protein APHWI1_0261 [Anaplasma phagocytophilum str. ApWI1]KJV87109.1 hypothetical protein APHNYW_0772 [Anaplasma phagocytophilum str. ApNYW]KJV98826.1 hypothetical protein OTSANNIE_1033 [Anaplasma phagocytophilum str. Annie]KJZ98745.
MKHLGKGYFESVKIFARECNTSLMLEEALSEDLLRLLHL